MKTEPVSPSLGTPPPLQKQDEQEKGKSHASSVNIEITCLFAIHAASHYHIKVEAAESKNQVLNKENH